MTAKPRLTGSSQCPMRGTNYGDCIQSWSCLNETWFTCLNFFGELLVGTMAMVLCLAACNPSQLRSTATQTAEANPSQSATDIPTASATATITPIPPTESATVRPTATWLTPWTSTPYSTREPSTPTPGWGVIPTYTPTMDLAALIPHTPAPPGECPAINPDLEPNFASESGYWDWFYQQVLDFLNNSGDPERIISA